MTQPNPFRYFKTSPEVIRLAVMMYDTRSDRHAIKSALADPGAIQT